MSLRERILDQALVLASESGSWEGLTLHDVARALDLSLADIHRHYPQKDDLVEAWFDRADRALLERVPGADWSALPVPQRIERALLAWLEPMAEHRALTGQMLLYKLEPGHVHLQAAGILRISRTVQWLREAAQLEATHSRRVVQEIALSGLYLTTFVCWLTDDTSGQERTRALLRRGLEAGESFGLWV